MSVRATVVLDEFVVEKVRQMFAGNLSKGVNELLREHLSENKAKGRGFGMFAGMISSKDLEVFEREELD